MSENIPRSANLLVDLAVSTPGIIDQIKQDPEKILKSLATIATEQLPPPAYLVDKWIYRIVVSSLGAVVVLAVVGAFTLAILNGANDKIVIPDLLTALGAAAIGALAGLLAPSPISRSSG